MYLNQIDKINQQPQIMFSSVPLGTDQIQELARLCMILSALLTPEHGK